MEKRFRTLFKGEQPSVRLFNRRLSGLTMEEIGEFYNYAYSLGLTRWEQQTVYYQNFLRRLVQHDRVRFLSFTHRNILGEMRYQLQDPVMAARLIGLVKPGEKQKVSGNHLAFSFLLGFECPLQISCLEKRISSRIFMPEELQDIKGKAIIDTGEKRSVKEISPYLP